MMGGHRRRFAAVEQGALRHKRNSCSRRHLIVRRHEQQRRLRRVGERAVPRIPGRLADGWPDKGYVGAAPSFVGARYEIETPIPPHIDDAGESLGGWIEAGVAWRLGDHFSLGPSGRALTFTSVNLFGVNGNANYWQIGPLLGWSWPSWKR
jgi:hypothetical protein